MTEEKIEAIVRTMAQNPNLISDTKLIAPDNFSFTYKTKYHWSIFKVGEDIVVFFHPKAPADSIIFDSSTGNSSSRKDAFSMLFETVREKIYGFKDMVDDILSDSK